MCGKGRLILAGVRETDQTKQRSAGERRARGRARRQQAEVGSLYHAQEGGTHGVGQILQLERPGITTEKQRLSHESDGKTKK